MFIELASCALLNKTETSCPCVSEILRFVIFISLRCHVSTNVMYLKRALAYLILQFIRPENYCIIFFNTR